MVRMLLPFAAALASCTPSPQEAAMRNSRPAAETAVQATSEASSPSPGSGGQDPAAQGPIYEPLSAAASPAPAASEDSPAEAQGRRVLSTAFVMVGPDGRLVVELRDGQALVLRNVVMRPKDYCGEQVLGPKPGARYCGGYAEVVSARPGAAPAR